MQHVSSITETKLTLAKAYTVYILRRYCIGECAFLDQNILSHRDMGGREMNQVKLYWRNIATWFFKVSISIGRFQKAWNITVDKK